MQDLAKDRAPHYKKARRFFDGVASQLVQQQHSLDVFACALDQVCIFTLDNSALTSSPSHPLILVIHLADLPCWPFGWNVRLKKKVEQGSFCHFTIHPDDSQPQWLCTALQGQMTSRPWRAPLVHIAIIPTNMARSYSLACGVDLDLDFCSRPVECGGGGFLDWQ